MLMRAPAVGMVHGVLRDSPDRDRGLRQAPVRGHGLPRLGEGLLAPSRPGDDAHDPATSGIEFLELPRREADHRARSLAHDDRGGPRRPPQPAPPPPPALPLLP